MGAPSATVWDSPDFLDIDVDHVIGPFRDDRPRFAKRVAVGVDEPAAVQTELGELPRYCATTNSRADIGART